MDGLFCPQGWGKRSLAWAEIAERLQRKAAAWASTEQRDTFPLRISAPNNQQDLHRIRAWYHFDIKCWYHCDTTSREYSSFTAWYKFPYDRYAADHLRQCVFAGTTNKMDFLPMGRSGNRRFLPVQVHPEQAETHILADEEASRAYIDLMWAEIMAIYESGEYSTHLTREMEEKQAREQEKYMQEDTRAGQIYGFMETYAAGWQRHHHRCTNSRRWFSS